MSNLIVLLIVGSFVTFTQATPTNLTFNVSTVDKTYLGKVVFLGDSITQLWNCVIWDEYFVPLGAINVGVFGDVTQQTIDRIQNGLIDNFQSKLAVLKIGTNDVEEGESAAHIAAQIGIILSLIKAKEPNVRILLLGLLPRAGIQLDEKVRKINELIRIYDDGYWIRFLNMESQFSTGLGALIPGLYMDGLHLTKEGYQVWAQTMAPLFNEMYANLSNS